MLPTIFNIDGTLLFSTLVSKMPIWLADFSSPFRIVRTLESDGSEYCALQNYDLVNHDPWIICWKLQQPNPNILCFISQDSSFVDTDNTTKVLETLKSLGFNWSAIQLDSNSLVIKVFQDGKWYASYKVLLTGEVPSLGVIEYISKAHNCSITIEGKQITIIQNVMPKFSPPKTSSYELRKSYDLTGSDLTRLENWKMYSVLHFNENIHLLGYPVKIDLNRIQYSTSHEVYRFEWLDKVPPTELLNHVFCNTCYRIFIFSEDTPSYKWAISVTKWGSEPVTSILSDREKCNCEFCTKLKADRHYQPAVLYSKENV
jgi:hypothetical protein